MLQPSILPSEVTPLGLPLYIHPIYSPYIFTLYIHPIIRYPHMLQPSILPSEVTPLGLSLYSPYIFTLSYDILICYSPPSCPLR